MFSAKMFGMYDSFTLSFLAHGISPVPAPCKARLNGPSSWPRSITTMVWDLKNCKPMGPRRADTISAWAVGKPQGNELKSSSLQQPSLGEVALSSNQVIFPELVHGPDLLKNHGLSTQHLQAASGDNLDEKWRQKRWPLPSTGLGFGEALSRAWCAHPWQRERMRKGVGYGYRAQIRNWKHTISHKRTKIHPTESLQQPSHGKAGLFRVAKHNMHNRWNRKSWTSWSPYRSVALRTPREIRLLRFEAFFFYFVFVGLQ